MIVLSRERERLVLLAFCLINFTHIVDFMIMMPLGPQFIRIFGISPLQFSYLVSIYTLSAGVFGFVSAFFVDRFDRKFLLVNAYLGFLLGTLACAFSPNFWGLLLARMLTGAFGGLLSSLVYSTLADLIPLERRGAAMGFLTTGFALASVFGVPIGLYFASHISWHAPFIAVLLVGVFVWLLLLKSLPDMPRKPHIHRGNPFSVLVRIYHSPGEKWALCLTLFLVFGHFTIVPFISPSMVANVGFREDQLMWIYLVGGITSAINSPLCGRLADRYGSFKVFSFYSFLALGPLLWVTQLGPSPLPLALAATTSFFIVAGGRWIPGTTMASAVVGTEHRASFMSINSCVQQLAFSGSAALSGLIVVNSQEGHILHYERVGYIAALFSLIAIFVAWRANRYVKF